MFAVALLVTMPATVAASLVALPPQVEGLSGGLWAGRAALAGGHALEWRLSARDLWRGRLTAEATLEGPDTVLDGDLAASPFGVEATGWTGRAGPSLLALGPRLIVEGCTSRAVVDVGRLAWSRSGAAAAEGTVAIAGGTCALRRGGGALEVPAMTLALSTAGADAQATLTRDEDGAALASLGVTGDRRLLLRVEPEGAALVPGMPASAATELEYPF